MIARKLLWSDGLTLIGLVDIGHEDTHRSAVIYNMVEVGKQIQAALCADKANAEQSVFMQVEGLYQLGLQCLQFCVTHLFNALLVRSIRRLHHRITIGILFYPRLDKAMSLNSLFNGMSQLLLIDRCVE